MNIGGKKNRSSAHQDDKTCRHCDTGALESQKHLETCTGTNTEDGE